MDHRFARRRSLSVLGLVAVWMIGAGCADRQPTTYSIDVTYSALPRDDRAIEEWIDARPDTGKASVSRNGQRVSIQFGTNQAPSPTLLREVMAECDRLGYRGRVSYRGRINDSSQRGTNRQTMWVEFEKLPADDRVMEQWLDAAPGVSNRRVSRSGKVVAFAFDLTNPPPPAILADILKKCRESGYEGEAGSVSAFGRYEGDPPIGR